MRQRLRVDLPILLTYLGWSLPSCRSAPEPVVPEGAQSVPPAEVAPWVTSTLPREQLVYRFKWVLRDGRGSAGVRGAVRVAPPDSLRLDVAGPLGSGSASPEVVG